MKTACLFFAIVGSAAIAVGAEPAKEATYTPHGTYAAHETHMAKPIVAPVKLPVAAHAVAAPLGQANAATAKHSTAALNGTTIKRKP